MKNTSLPRIVFATLLAISPAVTTAMPQHLSGSHQSLEAIATDPVNRGLTVGLVATVSRGGEIIFESANGLANAEWEAPMTADAMFEVGSIAKQFTAVAILQLRDAGKLDLENDIAEWVPELGLDSSGIELRQLLSHQSGIYRFDDTPEWEKNTFMPGIQRDAALELISISPAQFGAGEAQAYSNAGYWLLGLVVERASGQRLEEYLDSKIFQPLGMSRSMYCNSNADVSRRAHGYMSRAGEIRRVPMVSYAWVFAPGAVCSSAGDLIRWMHALHGGELLSAESYRQMTTAATLNDGTKLQYGMGIKVGEKLDGRRFIGHGGSAPGFRADATWYPDEALAVVVLMNSAGPGLSASAVSSVLAMEASGVTKGDVTFYTGDPSPFEGEYVNVVGGNREGLTINVAGTPNGLAFSLNGSPLRPLPWARDNTFYGGESAVLTFVFDRQDSNHASGLRRDDAGNHYVLRRQ